MDLKAVIEILKFYDEDEKTFELMLELWAIDQEPIEQGKK